LGSVAAPTAGFHFSEKLLKKLKSSEVKIEFVTLHVGYGTFQPVKVEDIAEHKMHAEFIKVEKDVIQRLLKYKKEGRRIIAVGTTSVRALETVFASAGARAPVYPSLAGTRRALARRSLKTGFINIFIYPGYKFKFIDGLITNFHLPKSTLLMLVSAFAGLPLIKKAYHTAVRNKYRFYSFGDGMLIS
jgi:S-adenosylmethionine:tRNA ribosyltransferase-isomerase